jgi:pimeloyl-ACP methyl ester carboxylesterase
VLLLAIIAGLFAAGISYQLLGTLRDRRRFIAPGRLIRVGPCRLHLHEQGAGDPAVVLESGIAGSSLSWAVVQPEIAKFTRVCSYDRAGLGWSEECLAPRTVAQMVSELNSLLQQDGISPPYVLVGHSFGGLLIRAYAHLRPEEVAGLVFVDPVSLEYWANCSAEEQQRLRLGARLSRRGAWLARLGVVRLTLAALVSGGRFFPKLLTRATAGQGTKVVENLLGEVQKLPQEVWPMICSHWSSPKCFHALASYLQVLPESARAALRMPIPPHIPFVILSASNARDEELKERESWVQQSRAGRHIRVERSGHWVQLEQPDLVVGAVREMVDAMRTLS